MAGYDELSVSYSDLKKSVARFLGYNHVSLTEDQAEIIDDCIQSGIRNFYYPAASANVDSNFEWSFLRQNSSITLQPGVDNYALPDDFGRMAGQMYFNLEQNGIQRGVVIAPYGEVRKLLDSNPNRSEPPRYAAVISQKNDGEKSSRCKIYFFPKPDAPYRLDYSYYADTGKLDENERPYPLGGSMYSELIRECCLAAAEENVNDERGIHSQKAESLLASFVAKDRKAGAQIFGRIGDPGAFGW